jgi:hypothetical protein
MTVLNQDDTIQTLILIPRNYIDGDTLTLIVRDEQTNLSYTYSIIEVYPNVNDLVYATAEITCLKESSYFEYKITNQRSEIIYKDRIFSTNQSKDVYSINQGNYNALNTSNNDYIII